MSLFRIVLKSLRQHLLSTAVTAVSLALAVGLLMTVWVVKEQSQTSFKNVTAGFDAVLGARGSKLQLVLNSIFHLEASPGNIRWSDYEFIKKNPAVELAVPLAVGDNFHGYRLVGTAAKLFDHAYAKDRKYEIDGGGRFFEEGYKEAVVGSYVAQKLGLRYKDTFNPYHGLNYDAKAKHDDVYTVVGVLKPTNTPADRVIWIPISGLQTMAGHDPKAATDVSAVLVKLRAPAAGFMLDQMYNKQGDKMTFAFPIGAVMSQLFAKIGWFDKVLEAVAYLVALVAVGSILASIYNSMNERKRDIAIMRALGAHRGTIFSTVVLEAGAIATLGVLAGFLFYAVIMSAAAHLIREQTGVVLEPFARHPVMLWAPLGMIALGALAGVVPALKAYRTHVAEHLAPVS